MLIKKTLLALAAVSVALPGCAIRQDFTRAAERLDGTTRNVDRLKNILEENAATGATVVHSRPRLAGDLRKLTKVELPARFNAPIDWDSPGSETLADHLSSFTGLTGLKIRVGELSFMSYGGPGADAVLSAQKMPLSYKGTVKGFLDEVTEKLDASWRYNADTREVEFFRYETQAISLFLPPGKKGISSSISLSGGSGTTGNVSVSHESSVDPWSSVMTGVTTILGAGGDQRQMQQPGAGGAPGGAPGAGPAPAAAPVAGAGARMLNARGNGGFAVANPELGVITVTARPAVMANVLRYLQSINKRFAQNVLIDVKVFNVSLDSGSSAGVSLSTVSTALGKYNAGIVASGLRKLDGTTPSQLTIDAFGPGGGSVANIVVEALSQVGRTSLQTQGQIVAINGQPAPFQNVREITYVASSSTTTIPNAGVQTTVQPGMRPVGFTANFLPQILGDNRILLQYQMQLSSLVRMNSIGTGNNTTQLPEVASQSLQQQVFLRDGQSVLLFGFDQEQDTDNGDNGLLSHSRVAKNQRNLNVVLIQVNTGMKHGEI